MANTLTNGGTADAPSKDPHLPPLHRVGNLIAPKAPQDIAATGLEAHVLADLMVKWGFTETRFTTEWVARQLHLSLALARQLLERVCLDGTMEQLWQTGQGGHHYRITAEGRQHASRLLEICGYIGPAPVSLEAYAAMLRWQFANTPPVRPERVAAALSGLVLSPRSRGARRPRRLLRSEPVSLRTPRKREKQHRPEAPCRPSRRLLDPLRHQRGQRRDPPVR